MSEPGDRDASARKPDLARGDRPRLTIAAGHGRPQIQPIVRTPPAADRKIADVYDYKDAAGQLLYQVVRFDPKAFMQRRPDAAGGWLWDLEGVSLVLYHLPEVSKADTVLIVEGEKDVETAFRLGLPPGWAATCNAFGSSRWHSSYGEMLRDKNVVLCPDTDAAGQRHLRQIGRDLVGKVRDLRLVVLPDKIKDLSQWAEGKTHDQFIALLDSGSPVDFPP